MYTVACDKPRGFQIYPIFHCSQKLLEIAEHLGKQKSNKHLLEQ